MKKKQICYICGKSGANSIDHIPPKGIYPKEHKKELLKLPAHKDCNSNYAKDDEIFRNFINMSGFSNPMVKSFWDTHIKRSFIRNPGARKELQKRVTPVWVRRNRGLGAIRREAILMEDNLVQRQLSRWFKGVYFIRNNKPYPSDGYSISGEMIYNGIEDNLQSLLKWFKAKGIKPHWKFLIPNKLAYFDMWATEDINNGIVIFVFYDQAMCIISAFPEDFDEQISKLREERSSSGIVYVDEV